jgi:hypothetical protein
MLLVTLLIADSLFICFAALFTYDSIREKEPGHPK